MPNLPSWSSDQLIAACKNSRNLNEVNKLLYNNETSHGNNQTLKKWIKKLEINLDHWNLPHRTFNLEELQQVVKESLSFREVCLKLATLKARSPNAYRGDDIEKFIKKINLDTSHFLGRSKPRESQKGKKVCLKSLGEILKENSKPLSRNDKKRIFESGLLIKKCSR